MSVRTTDAEPPGPLRTRPLRYRVSGRIGALGALLSALLHAIAGSVPCGPPLIDAATTLMTLTCLLCAWHLWTRAAARDWMLTVALAIAMIAVHIAVPAHRLPASAGHRAGPLDGSAEFAMHGSMFAAGAEALIAVAVLLARCGVRFAAGTTRAQPW